MDGRPAREVQRRRAHAVAERAEHRVDERALVPGPVVAPAVDEERRRNVTPLARALCDVGVDARRGRRHRCAESRGVHAEVGGDGDEVVLGELRERVMSLTCASQNVSASGAELGELRGAPRDARCP